ncbi:MAG: transcription-repair coupling factor [Clostridia bacterium]|nr:transcription-repair coupling factor [Clostridia bacterium]
MPLAGFLEIISKSEEFRQVLAGFFGRKRRQLVYGLGAGGLSLWLAALYRKTGFPFLVVVPNIGEAQRLAQDLQALIGSDAQLFPARETIPGEIIAQSPELECSRLAVLERVLSGRTLVVAPVEAVGQRLVPPEILRPARVVLRREQETDWEELLARLEYLGYERVDLVEVPGHYSVRGGLIDVFPRSAEYPVRVEFFGDQVVSLRPFNPETQRSTGELEEVEFGPAREMLLPGPVWERGLAAWEADFQAALERLASRDRTAAQNLTRYMAERLERARQGLKNLRLDDLWMYFYPHPCFLWHYFSSPPLVVLVEPARLLESLDFIRRERLGLFREFLAQGRALPGQAEPEPAFEQLAGDWQRGPVLGFSSLPRTVSGLSWQMATGVRSKQPPRELAAKPGLLTDMLRRWQAEGYALLIMLGGPQRARHLAELLREEGFAPVVADGRDAEPALLPGQLVVAWGGLSQGVELSDLRLVVLTEAEVYGQQRRPRPLKVFREGTKLSGLTDLAEGDYVVHIHHGIGRYQGIKRLTVGGVDKDYLLIQYAGEDRLYVPVDQISLVHKYIGSPDGQPPKLSRLASGEWAKVKSRVKSTVRDLAKELLELYAARETVAGHAFGPDTVWQQEFEEAFPYRETPDQLRAIAEVKADMERSKPMDRLLCGDVGYGKTEVALRAAFKAVMENRQVAVLVPTTVLAQQHYRTFGERFAPYPVRVEVLSRFRTPKEQREIVRGLALGQIDIVIGTHRLLSRDVKFKDLGLLIIDEEQRFGVTHKEKIKQLRHSVDVLTLSATPIPRTLHMSLVGVRDMSLIETAPEDRYPVQTYVVEYSDELVREAIRRELGRGGQVYFVHNRIADIERVAARIKELVPEARVAVGHGRLPEEDLEQVMVDFVEGGYDVLVCTTIVENGLDIPNVNTLIVDEADNFGLAQLYQLRGRVGRSNRIAYAYFTYRRDRVINPLAEKRLAAIREFTALGSGFKIALRDLEIRGAGNLLGPEQHGHIQAVGFHLYCQLLEEAVREQKAGAKAEAAPEAPSLELSVDAYLADDYIRAAGLKMEFYRRLLSAETPEEVAEMEAELLDRFGEPPEPTARLLSLAYLRALARRVGVTGVQQQGKEVLVRFEANVPYQGEVLLRLAQRFPRRLAFSVTGGLTMRVRVQDLDQQGLLELLRGVFTTLHTLAGSPQGTRQTASVAGTGKIMGE